MVTARATHTLWAMSTQSSGCIAKATCRPSWLLHARIPAMQCTAHHQYQHANC